jgi:hypothetical protein
MGRVQSDVVPYAQNASKFSHILCNGCVEHCAFHMSLEELQILDDMVRTYNSSFIMLVSSVLKHGEIG